MSEQTAEFRLGDGRASGAASILLGALSLLAVLCFRHPELLTTPELRAVYPMPLVRGTLFAALLASLVLALASVLLSRRLRLGLTGIGLTAAAVLLGGAWIEVDGPVVSRRYIGLDWFVLDLLVLALLFVPLERMFPLRAEQRVLRPGWRTDLAHFGASHLLIQVLALVTMAPAIRLLGPLQGSPLQRAVGGLPDLAQFALVVVIADLCQYAVHRAFHAIPVLWRFHAIHHSSPAMDWLAGSRLHLVDIIATRAAGFAALYALGFEPGPLQAYLVFVAFHAVLIHANVRFKLWGVRWLVATPLYHHWHHALEPEAVDKNFAVHLPIIDRLFGTAYLPPRWPASYGAAGEPVPDGWWRQVRMPFLARRD